MLQFSFYFSKLSSWMLELTAPQWETNEDGWESFQKILVYFTLYCAKYEHGLPCFILII